jgi:hypothetical protein
MLHTSITIPLYAKRSRELYSMEPYYSLSSYTYTDVVKCCLAIQIVRSMYANQTQQCDPVVILCSIYQGMLPGCD